MAAEPGPLVYEVALHRFFVISYHIMYCLHHFISYHILCIVHKVALYREVDEVTSKEEDGNIEEANAVPIGARLQLRAKIDTSSVWQHVRLRSVVLSPDSSDPNAPGSVTLVRDGCRVEEFASIVPRQPWLKENSSSEVRLEFEAVLLDVSRRGQGRYLNISNNLNIFWAGFGCTSRVSPASPERSVGTLIVAAGRGGGALRMTNLVHHCRQEEAWANLHIPGVSGALVPPITTLALREGWLRHNWLWRRQITWRI